ncbi:hypothetical protein EI94DRAFT_1701673 [Lactarius quietus]|nr:hypothetical protein EI94DRAFT_1701673 [Lactarius quietus]
MHSKSKTRQSSLNTTDWLERRKRPHMLSRAQILKYSAQRLRRKKRSKPSRHIRNDEDLTWEEMLNAKNVVLHFINKAGTWPAPHVESMATFYFNLKFHPRKLHMNGKKALLLYQSHAQCKWYDTLENNEGFDLQII